MTTTTAPRTAPTTTDRSVDPTTRTNPRRSLTGRGSVVLGSLLMVGVSLVLFFVPIVNGLLGGLAGGYLVGTVKRALLAAVLPAVVVAAGLWILFALLDAPVWGVLAGLAVGGFIVLSDLGLFLGAAIGGALGAREGRPALAG